MSKSRKPLSTHQAKKLRKKVLNKLKGEGKAFHHNIDDVRTYSLMKKIGFINSLPFMKKNKDIPVLSALFLFSMIKVVFNYYPVEALIYPVNIIWGLALVLCISIHVLSLVRMFAEISLNSAYLSYLWWLNDKVDKKIRNYTPSDSHAVTLDSLKKRLDLTNIIVKLHDTVREPENKGSSDRTTVSFVNVKFIIELKKLIKEILPQYDKNQYEDLLKDSMALGVMVSAFNHAHELKDDKAKKYMTEIIEEYGDNVLPTAYDQYLANEEDFTSAGESFAKLSHLINAEKEKYGDDISFYVLAHFAIDNDPDNQLQTADTSEEEQGVL